MNWLVFVVMSLMAPAVSCVVEINENMKSFSIAHKGVRCDIGKEIEVFYHNTTPGVLTEQWFTGKNCFNEQTTVRYYIDGDETPTIEANLYLMHGVATYNGQLEPLKPWGTKWIGHLASGGGLYNTMRIPFQKSIRVTFVSQTNGYYWFILRGVENYPLIVGDLKLPSTAKLVLKKYELVRMPPYEYVNLASSVKSGMLFMVTLAAKSVDYTYLEGCYRFVTKQPNGNSSVQYLSSGTEDFYLSAYYFDKGLYHTDQAGLTYLEKPGTMSAYKYFVDDPMLFDGSFSLVWRIGEKNDNNCFSGSDEACFFDGDMTYCKPAPNQRNEPEHTGHVQLSETEISSYVWFYEW